MIDPLRSCRSGISLLVLAASLAAQDSTVPAPATAAPAPAPATAAPAPAADAETAPDFDVLQFTPDEAFIDLRANLADTWSATLGVLAELNYPIQSDLAYLDAGGQIALADLWVAVEPHVSRSVSFTRVRIALGGDGDDEYMQVRAEVFLDAVANRLQPPPAAPEEQKEERFSYPFTPAPVYETTYVPYYVSYAVPVCAPYYGPYFSSPWYPHHAWWANNCWYPGGWSGGWAGSSCHNGFVFGFNHSWWNWGLSWGWGNLYAGFGSPWGWPGCGAWGGWNSPVCSSGWNGPSCTSGLWPWDNHGSSFSAGIVVADSGSMAGPQDDFDFHRVPLDADILHSPRARDVTPEPDRPTTRVTSRERRVVPAAELSPRIVVTRTAPRHSRDTEAPTAPTSLRSPGISTTVVTINGAGSTTPRAGSVVRMPSANYASRTVQAPSGRVSTTSAPRNNSGTVSSTPIVLRGSPTSTTHSRSSSSSHSGSAPSSTASVAPSMPVYGSPQVSTRTSAPPVVSAPSSSPAPRSSGHRSSGGASTSPKPAPSAPSMSRAPSKASAGAATSTSPGSSSGGRAHGKGRP